MNVYDTLLKKLDEFIKKYYKIKLIKGFLISIGILTGLYLIISFSEFYLYMSPGGRGIFLFGFLAALFSIFVFLIVIPALKLINIGRMISYEQASGIISKHFTEIKDKLINILELKKLTDHPESDSNLVNASINQKIDEIKVFPFKNAIHYKQTYKYLKYTIPPIIILISVLLISPSIIKDSNERIIHFKQTYEKPLPFRFELKTTDLYIKKGESKTIKVQIFGDYIPDEVFIESSGNEIIMKRSAKTKNEFYYEFKNIYNSFHFKFVSHEISSPDYSISVLPAPALLNFAVSVNMPEYTGERDTVYFNTNDFVVPYGSVLLFNFKTIDSDSLILKTADQRISLTSINKEFNYKLFAKQSLVYHLGLQNKYFKTEDISTVSITVIPDLYPAIVTEQQKDTANIYVSYFRGIINDDYGFAGLEFKYRILDKENAQNDEKIPYVSFPVPISKSSLKQEFFYVFDFTKIKADENQKIEYFFEVGDNDAISGSKKARSEIMIFEIPTYKEIKEFENTVNESIQDKLDRTIKLSEELQKEIQQFKEKNIDGNSSDWENKQMLQNILDKQNALKNLTKELAQENKEKNKTLDNLREKNDELLEKQEEIQKLLDEIMTDELKELMKQIEELQNKFDEKMMEKLLEEQKFSYEELSDRLDRTKELLKREQIEQKINNAIDELNKLSEEQKELAKDQLEKKGNKEELLEKQKEIEERFNEIMKEYDQAMELNKELKKEMKLDELTEEKNAISEEFKKTNENMQKGKSSKASDSQSKNSENMKDMAEKMQAGMEMNSMQQQGESLETLRRILENLITFSFTQEKLMGELKNLTSNNPKFISVYDQQLSIADDFKVIEDSLKALATRVPMLNKAVMDELFEINSNLRESSVNLKARDLKKTQGNQIKIMTSSNNLALLLSEIMKQMKEQMQGGGSGGSSSKKNPQKGKQDAFDGLKSGQERLKKQMEEMLNQLKNGQGQFDENAQNKQLAKMLAEQEIMRQMLNEMNSNFSLSPETQKLLREINKMAEDNEKDIVNRKITPELLERQKQIETRLLEAENSENKRKTENKRESEEGKDNLYKSPEDIFKSQKNKDSFNENLYKQNLQMKLFYKQLYEKYSEEINR
jgi:hypothetical protein